MDIIQLRFFDIKKFYEHLNTLVKTRLKKGPSHKNLTKLFAEELQSSSFQVMEREILGSHSITPGYYTNPTNQKIGYREELIFRVDSPPVFRKDHQIPKGKYRIKVFIEEGDERPTVQTFSRKNFSLGFIYNPHWSVQYLPANLPLDKILQGESKEYLINPISISSFNLIKSIVGKQ